MDSISECTLTIMSHLTFMLLIHAFKTGGQAKIAIGNSLTNPNLILVQGMNAKDAKKAIEIVLE